MDPVESEHVKYSSLVTQHMGFAQQGGQAGIKVLVGIYYGMDAFPGRRNQMNGKKEVERGQEAFTFIDTLRVSQHMITIPGCTVWSPWHTQSPL